jgi:hypothetical protein
MEKQRAMTPFKGLEGEYIRIDSKIDPCLLTIMICLMEI